MDYYRKCAAIFLINSDGLIFAGERIDIAGEWQIPQGGVEDGETHLDGAIRELYEETGVHSIKLLKNTSKLYKYDFPGEIRSNLGKIYGTNLKGQELRFFLFRFTGEESEINISSFENKEFANWKWMPADELLNSMVEFKKNAFINAAIELKLFH
jgi:putative (di)nucleoside polyphosphate hydrolase